MNKLWIFCERNFVARRRMKFDKNYQSAAQRSCCTSRSCPGIMQFAAPSRVAARRCLVCSSFMHGHRGGRPPGQALHRTIVCFPTKKGSSHHATERPKLFTICLQKKLDLFKFRPGMNPPGHDFCPGINDKKEKDDYSSSFTNLAPSSVYSIAVWSL